jgi:hypothetical protein
MFFVLKNGVLPLMEVDGRDGALPTRRYGRRRIVRRPLKNSRVGFAGYPQNQNQRRRRGIFVDCIRK